MVQADAEKRAEASALDAEGQPKKRGRGRPLGSKTKPRPEDVLGPADTPAVRPKPSSRPLERCIRQEYMRHGSKAYLFWYDGFRSFYDCGLSGRWVWV